MLTIRLLAVIAALACFLPLFECGVGSSKSAPQLMKRGSHANEMVEEFCRNEPREYKLIDQLGQEAWKNGYRFEERITGENWDRVQDAFFKVIGDELREEERKGSPINEIRARSIGFDLEGFCFDFVYKFGRIFARESEDLSEKAKWFLYYVPVCNIVHQGDFSVTDGKMDWTAEQDPISNE